MLDIFTPFLALLFLGRNFACANIPFFHVCRSAGAYLRWNSNQLIDKSLLHPCLNIGSFLSHGQSLLFLRLYSGFPTVENYNSVKACYVDVILWTLILILMKYLLCWLWCMRIDYLLWCLIVNCKLSRLTRWLNKTTHILWLPSGSTIAVVRITFGRFCQYCLETFQIYKRYNLFWCFCRRKYHQRWR